MFIKFTTYGLMNNYGANIHVTGTHTKRDKTVPFPQKSPWDLPSRNPTSLVERASFLTLMFARAGLSSVIVTSHTRLIST